MEKATRTHTGLVRTVNQDRYLVQTLPCGYTLGIVADGMGGHQAGEIASRVAVETILNLLIGLPPGLTIETYLEALQKAILTANESIFMLASKEQKYFNMGTTVVAVLIDDKRILMGYIGDSRAYMIHQGEIRQITTDHTLVQRLISTGQITPEEALVHPHRHVLTKALGTDAEVEVTMGSYSNHPGAFLLLCSDGLTNEIEDTQLFAVITQQSNTVEEKAEKLLQLALLSGGEDNITLLLLHNMQKAMELKEVKPS